MSVLGTGIAAAVAQTALQAQQVGRQQARRGAETARAARRVREVLEAQLKRLEEDDAAEPETQIHTDASLQDPASQPDSHDPQGQDGDAAPKPAPGEAEEAQPDAAEAKPAAWPGAYAADGQSSRTPLPHQLDVRA